MSLDIDIKTDGFIQTSRKLKKGAQPLLGTVITRIATFMERTAKENLRTSVYSTPAPRKPFRRSGKARQSIIRAVLGTLTQRVYMGVKYGKYLEEGTGIYHTPGARKPYWTTFGGILDKPVKYKGMKARPFWAPAIKKTRENVPRIMQEEASKLMN